MIKLYIGLYIFLFSSFSKVNAQVDLTHPDSDPARIRDLEWIFGNIVIAIWSFSIPYFLFMIISVGAKYMLSFGDEQKASAVKEKGKSLILSAVFLFGGYIAIQTAMSLFVFRNPDDCFKTQLDNAPFFQFFFPNVCSGASTT